LSWDITKVAGSAFDRLIMDIKTVHELSNVWKLIITIAGLIFIIVFVFIFHFQVIGVALGTLLCWLWKDFLDIRAVAGISNYSDLDKILREDKSIEVDNKRKNYDENEKEDEVEKDIKRIITYFNSDLKQPLISIPKIHSQVAVSIHTLNQYLHKLYNEGFLERTRLPGGRGYYIFSKNKLNTAINKILVEINEQETVINFYKFLRYRRFDFYIDALIETEDSIYIVNLETEPLTLNNTEKVIQKCKEIMPHLSKMLYTDIHDKKSITIVISPIISEDEYKPIEEIEVFIKRQIEEVKIIPVYLNDNE
jgi:predicted DNA-binding transcriptional regulator